MKIQMHRNIFEGDKTVVFVSCLKLRILCPKIQSVQSGHIAEDFLGLQRITHKFFQLLVYLCVVL